MNTQRINRYLSDKGLCSRRTADEWIEAGRVTINGARAKLGDPVAPGDRVRVDGRLVAEGEEKVYLALNKPRGIVCTADPREPMNVVSYLGLPQRVYPVGRLDKDSEGLLLLTNDGDIVNRVLRASEGHEKEYRVWLDGPVTPDFVRRMAAGVPILGTVTAPCRVKKTGENAFAIILTQGLNRQIRRMCEYLGRRVVRLQRVRVMHIRLDGLQVGHYRYLTSQEIGLLKGETQHGVEET